MLRFSAILSAILFVVGCGGGEEAKSEVSGTVSLDNEPLAVGEIAFARPGKAALVLEVKDGKFSGEVPVGKFRIEISSYEEVEITPMEGADPIIDRRNIIPPKYNSESKEEAEVKAEGPNTFEFSVSSK